MGFKEAKKYISELHKKQDDPYLWPDYLTGLPDKNAIVQKNKRGLRPARETEYRNYKDCEYPAISY